MEAIVLAGGFGTRLRSVVADVPKPMAPVGGRPFLSYILARLARQGITRTVLSVGYKADDIVSYFRGSHEGMRIGYARESVPLGTGGGIRLALAEVEDDHAVILNGDTFLDVDIAALESQWRARGNPIIVGRDVPDASRYGRLQIAGGRVTGFLPGAPGPAVVNAGCYVFPRGLFDGEDLPQAFSLEADYLATAVGRRRFDTFVCDGYFIDIGIPEDYARAQVELPGVVA
jgi:D-glycero-alpha-D-manno-heptose 1-phosphate guanylyltransferase